MINKIDNWDNVEPNYGERKMLKAGGYICEVLAVVKEKSKNNNDMIVVNFDIAEGDEKGYYMKRYREAPRTDGKEPKWGGKYYIVIDVDGYEGRLKAFSTSLEESNQGYKWDWNEQNFKGKRFGGIFREEEYIANGEIRTSTKLWQVRSVKTIQAGEYEIPRKKEISDDERERIEERSNAPFEGFTPVTDDDLPF